MDPLNGSGGGGAPASAYRRARGFLGRIELVLLTIAAMMILAMSLYVTLGIVLRTFHLGKLYDEIAIIGEMMVAAISLSFAYVAADRGFVAVEVFTAHAGRRVRILLDILASLIGVLALVPITISAWRSGLRVWEEGSYFFGVLNLPEWPGYFAYIVGMGFFVLRLLDLLVYDTLRAFDVIADDDPETAAV